MMWTASSSLDNSLKGRRAPPDAPLLQNAAQGDHTLVVCLALHFSDRLLPSQAGRALTGAVLRPPGFVWGCMVRTFIFQTI